MATYSGDGNFTTSSATVTQTVQAAVNSDTVALLSSADQEHQENPGPGYYAVTFTATVTPTSGAQGTPSGPVSLYANGVIIGSAVALNANGVATSSAYTPAANGSYTITAKYSGDGNFSGFPTTPVASLTQTVSNSTSAYATTTTVSSNGVDASGQPVTFTASVAPTTLLTAPPNTNGPAGTVTFTDGATSLCTNVALVYNALANTNTATCTALGASLSAGANTITAAYTSSDGDFSASSGTTSQQVVVYDLESGLPYIGGGSGFLLTPTLAGHIPTPGHKVVVQLFAPGGSYCPAGCYNVWNNSVETARQALNVPVQVPMT